MMQNSAMNRDTEMAIVIGGDAAAIAATASTEHSNHQHADTLPERDGRALVQGSPVSLLDDLVGAREQHRGDGETKRLCGYLIYGEIKFRWLLDGNVLRLCAAQNLVNKLSRPSI
jgi:hypothetical protein